MQEGILRLIPLEIWGEKLEGKPPGLLLADSGSSLLTKVLTNQAEAMSQVLGRSIQDVAQQPSHAVVIARSDETIGAQKASCSFQVVLTQPTFRLHTDALTQASPAALHAFP